MVVGRLVLQGALAIAQGVNIACVVYNVAVSVSTAELTVLYVLIAWVGAVGPSCVINQSTKGISYSRDEKLYL